MTRVIILTTMAVLDPVWVVLYVVVIGLILVAVEAWKNELRHEC